MMKRKFLALITVLALCATAAGPVIAKVAPTGGTATAAAPAAPASAVDQTKVPHYFGPYPNWANSPQVIANAVVTITPVDLTTGTGAEATATVDPKTGAILAVNVTSPGSGYAVAPNVAIDAPGMTPTSVANAEAVISTGVLSSVAVNEAGFGFSAPVVDITGGTPIIAATAEASGGVDNVTVGVADGGSYAIQPIVEFSLPNLPGGVQATGTATLAPGALPQPVVSVTVANPGSGYTSAPTITIWDGAPNQAATPPAVAAATIGIGQIDVTLGGQGYTSPPIVTITDSVGVADKGASATATIAALGAVTAVNLVAPNFGGAGYLTPGLKKFVDPLPGLCDPTGGLAPTCSSDASAKTIPLAAPEINTFAGAPDSHYYEIAVVQYRMKFSSQLPATLLRGYVQLETPVNAPVADGGNGVSQHFALTNANLDPNLPDTPVLINGVQAYGVTPPHYLGPTIVAVKDIPVRILFRNLLPTTAAGGNLFLPVDTSIMGSGAGPNMMTLDANGVPVDMVADEGVVTDDVRNPACGEYPKPIDCFAENRATLHLHGGITPWISDGTAHQWITPAGETTAYPQGVSVQNVPDMKPVCDAVNDGCQTFYYTNQQSARLMFYHDHAWGITRLNVYAGEAAGYLLTDGIEGSLIAPGGALDGLSYGTPLVIQDKTFVSDNIAAQDPTWDTTLWGGTGSLWSPHVYMPAQNPGDPSGMSSFGRWMYGPWFWPPATDAKYQPIANPYYNMDPLAVPPFSKPLTDSGLHDGLGNLVPCNLDVPSTWQYTSDPFCEPALIPSTPNRSVGMEAFNDTPIVNGTIYPATTVDPKAYRFRVLNAANDRFWNLSWYVADPRTGTLSEVALNPAEVLAAQTDPVVFPTPDTTWSPPGPSWVQIGTEGGFLPTPVVVPPHPTTWITDPTRFDVGNVDQHSLLLAPAERADVIVDFSQFRGKTLILYNDAPAAFPARVPGYDYYTGGPDLSPAGAPTTLPGYGPNTRTIMQVTVSMAAPELAFDRPNTTADRMGALVAAFAHHLDGTGQPAGVFEAGSDPIIVGQAAYNEAYGTNFVAGGWCNSPTNPSARCDGYARIAEGSQPTDLFGFNTLAAPNAKMQIPFQPKGMHDEMNSANFDEWGRMTANLGMEAPGATPLLQNITLYPMVNPATEILDATQLGISMDVTPIASATDGTQIWKITHNGVDTHPIHWHLYDVQVINRVTWDDIVIPPDPAELGWKDTVRISPLQDTYVAVRPIVPTLPFEVPNSIRVLNPMMPLNARGSQAGPNGLEAGFNNTNILGNPVSPVINRLVNFAWEYTFHCHILSHEEMDMMRPVSVALPPNAASILTRTTIGNGGNARNVIAWQDNSITETSFVLQRTINGLTWTDVGTILSPLALPNVHQARQLTDTTSNVNTAYLYRVVAKNTVGYGGDFPTTTVQSISRTLGVNLPAAAPSPPAANSLTAAVQAGPQVRLVWTDTAANESGFVIERTVTGGTFAQIAVAPARAGTGSTNFTDTTVATGTTYEYRVAAVNLAGQSAYSNVASTVAAPPVPAAPSNLTAANGANQGSKRSVALTWADNSANETSFTIQRATNTAFTTGLSTSSAAANAITATQGGLSKATTYYFRIRANNAVGSSAWVNATPFPIVTNP